MSPSRRRDVIRLPAAERDPGPPAPHPLGDLNGTGKAKKGRRRRSPGPEPDPRDQMMLLMLEHIQGLNAAVAELTERVLLGALNAQIHHRRLERLEERCLEARQGPAGDVAATEDGETAVRPSETP